MMGDWIQFFKEAGLVNSAQKYAHIFKENNIRKDLLLELNKEYLKDMGITLLGDIIAILKHAKIVGQQEEDIQKEHSLQKVILTSSDTEDNDYDEDEDDNIRSNYKKDISEVIEKKSESAVTRILDHYIRNPTLPKILDKDRKKEKLQTKAMYNKETFGLDKSKTVPIVKKTIKNNTIQKTENKLDFATHPKPSVIKRPGAPVTSSDSIPEVRKPRRVLPEHEGGYKIKMPTGSTVRSRHILQKMKERKAKVSVFERLGNENKVSSTTQPENDVKFKTIVGTNAIKRISTSEKPSTSVFDRLGSCLPKNPSPEPQSLQYNGILKTSKKNSVKTIALRQTTMRADEETQSTYLYPQPKNCLLLESHGTAAMNSQGLFGESRELNRKISIKDRLGGDFKETYCFE
uniref:SAM domain-containing protein n=1 Tax=Clastoptera arizonana TaxID=38151 RepID=A0A1B6DTV2_9HEMI